MFQTEDQCYHMKTDNFNETTSGCYHLTAEDFKGFVVTSFAEFPGVVFVCFGVSINKVLLYFSVVFNRISAGTNWSEEHNGVKFRHLYNIHVVVAALR